MQGKDNFDELNDIAKLIRDGKAVVFPTETVYGIGTNGFNENAIKKLYDVKKRPYTKPISLLVSDYEMIEECTRDITEVEHKLMKAFFPGPFTIILKKSKLVPDILTNDTETVGIRMPDNQLTLELIKKVGKPIATSSANISGKTSGINIEEIYNDFKDDVDFYVDTGRSKLAVASTIIQVIDEKPIMLRQGTITKQQIDEVSK